MIGAVTPAVGVPGKVEASIISAYAESVVIRLPENSQALGIALRVDGKVSPMFPFMLGARLAADLHPVANPVIAPDGAIITAVSGTGGWTQRIPDKLECAAQAQVVRNTR